MKLTLGHSPDPDDAFMFYALATGKLDTGELEFEHILQDIQTLNERVRRGELDVSAVSFHAYAHLLDRYALLPCGCSMGDRYGPLLVARSALSRAELEGAAIAVPGELTTAFLVLKLYLPRFHHVVVPFDQIVRVVREGKADAGLLIHEGQLTYQREGLRKVADLGQWWFETTNLPLPLGGNVVRKALGRERMRQVASLVRESIRYGLAHRADALAYAMNFARDMDMALADRFVGMYVNDWTLDYGERGRQAIRTLLRKGHEAGLIPKPVELEFVE